MSPNVEFFLRFLNGTYDEWVVRPWSHGAARLDAKTCRALKLAVGDQVYQETLQALKEAGTVIVIGSIETADSNDSVLELTDYVE